MGVSLSPTRSYPSERASCGVEIVAEITSVNQSLSASGSVSWEEQLEVDVGDLLRGLRVGGRRETESVICEDTHAFQGLVLLIQETWMRAWM